ncbi:MAG: ribbon-helix-helix protein, CopG family [Candidatus Binataceae bacterium]
MRTRETITVSLPPAMRRTAEQVRRREHRTMSELVREALRVYCAMTAMPTYRPTAAELRAIEAGRAAFKRGDYLPLREYLDELERPAHRARQKAARGARR